MSKKHSVYVYGFEELGFTDIEDEEISFNGNTIKYIPFHDAQPLDNAEGLIIPQGIFEDFTEHTGFHGLYVEVKVLKDLLLHREREVHNVLKSGGWVCFLVNRIIDTVKQGSSYSDVSSTDLCKRLLNSVAVTKRNTISGITSLDTKFDEFRKYTETYGVGKTIFILSREHDFYKVLIEYDSRVFGFEAFTKLFFLPVHLVNTDFQYLTQLIQDVISSIEEYQQKHRISLPEWLNRKEFQEEKALKEELEAIKKRELQISERVNRLNEYKAVLTTSGELLRSILIRIFTNFFDFKLDTEDIGFEDFKIIDNNGAPLAFCEAKGTKKGVKREYINQVDSHRERANVDSVIPGILLINNEMTIDSYERRNETKIEKQHINHAAKLNVLIIRTIDLINFMILNEEDKNRTGVLSDLIFNSAGWLRVSADSIDITP